MAFRYYQSMEPLEPAVVQGLRERWMTVLTFRISAGLTLISAIASGIASEDVSSLMAGLAATGMFVVLASTLALVFGNCPRCKQQFAPGDPQLRLLFPWTACFAFECATCGVPIRAGG